MLGRAGESMPVPAQHMSPCMLCMLGTCWGRLHGEKTFTWYYRYVKEITLQLNNIGMTANLHWHDS